MYYSKCPKCGRKGMYRIRKKRKSDVLSLNIYSKCKYCGHIKQH